MTAANAGGSSPEAAAPTRFPFDEEITLEPLGDGSFRGAVIERWFTPAGPLGGFVMALMIAAFDRVVADPERTARSVTMHFLRAPVAGSVIARAELVKGGRTLSSLRGELEQDGRIVATALAAYGRPVAAPRYEDAPMPRVKPPGPEPDLFGAPPGELPAMVRRLRMQHRFGEAALSRADRAEIGGWYELDEGRPVDAAALAVLSDAWFPAPWPRLGALMAAPTIDLTVHFRTALPLPPSPILGRFRSRVARDGYFEEDGEMWAPDGTLVAQSRQLGLLLPS